MTYKTATIVTTVSVLLFLQTQPRLVYANQIGLAVYPPIITLFSQAPIDLKIPIQLRNTSDTELSVSTDLIPFLKTQIGGALPLYSLDAKTSDKLKQQISSLVSLRDGNVPLSLLTIEPHQTRDLTLFITIPKLYKSTDYYFSIRYTAHDSNLPIQSADDSVQTTQNISVTSNVLLDIGNQTPPQIFVSSFSPSSHIITSSSIPFLVAVKNNGSHFTKLSGTISITNVLTGMKKVIPLTTANVLATSERYLTPKDSSLVSKDINEYQSNINPILYPYVFSYHSPLLLGIYKAQLHISADSYPETIIKTTYFIGFPAKASLFVMVVGLLFFSVKKRVRRIRNKVES